MRAFTLTLVILILAFALHSPSEAQEGSFGYFLGSPKVEFVTRGEGRGRDMRLLEDFTYVDAAGANWTAKKGHVTDGASIPWIFWGVVGGPFEGSYRDAAIIHDWFCDSKDKPWQDVHRMFYYASRAARVGEIQSKILYAAVVFGGPRWGKGRSGCFAGCHAPSGQDIVVIKPQVTEAEAREVAAWIRSGNPNLDEIFQRGLKAHPEVPPGP